MGEIRLIFGCPVSEVGRGRLASFQTVVDLGVEGESKNWPFSVGIIDGGLLAINISNFKTMCTFHRHKQTQIKQMQIKEQYITFKFCEISVLWIFFQLS